MNQLFNLGRSAARPLSMAIAAGVGFSAMYNLSAPTELDSELVEGQVLKRLLHKPKLPYPLWDYNWDGRMTDDTSLQGHMEGRADQVKGTTRHVILVRHGQYVEYGADGDKHDKKRCLTPLGREQAEATGRRLALLQKGIDDSFGPCDIKIVRSSDMQRAKETAQIIAKHLNGVKLAPPDRKLNEALPAAIIPNRPELSDEECIKEIEENQGRIERAFHAHIYRGLPSADDRHEFEVIVCHGNIIRYFFCRCLQLPPEAWLRMSIFNCSITYLVLRPNGMISARSLGDIGHLDYDRCSFSSNHGFVW